MKKSMTMAIVLFAILALALCAVTAGDSEAADNWFRGVAHNVAWDAVTTYEDGTPISGETVTYNLYIKNVRTAAEIRVGSTPETTGRIVLPERGQYRLGVQAQLGEDVSPISWSDNAEACAAGDTFGARYLFPFWPKNWRHQ